MPALALVRHFALPVPHVLEVALVALVIWQVGLTDPSPTSFLLPLTFAATILVFSYEAGAYPPSSRPDPS